MSPDPPTPDHQRPGRLPAPGTAATAGAAPGPADLVRKRQLETRSPGPAANGSGACGTGSA